MNAGALTKALDGRRLDEITDRIRARIRRTVADIIDNGQDLAQVKAALDHGQFSEWIEREFSMSIRTAQRYMQAAKWAEGKNDIVSHLPPKTLYLLVAKSTPEEIKTDVLQSLEAGKKPDIRQIEERVRDARWTAKQKGVDQDPEAKRERRAKRERWEAELEKREERELQVLAEALQILSKLDREDLERLVVLMSTNDVTSQLWLALEWNLKDRGT